MVWWSVIFCIIEFCILNVKNVKFVLLVLMCCLVGICESWFGFGNMIILYFLFKNFVNLFVLLEEKLIIIFLICVFFF